MFDRTTNVLVPRGSGPGRVSIDAKIVEQRAPTDESVRLLAEMQAAAEHRVIDAIKVGDTTFECVVHPYLDAMSNQMVWRAIFKLNGQSLVAAHSADCRKADDFSAMAAGLRDEIAKVIADTILARALLELERQVQYRRWLRGE